MRSVAFDGRRVLWADCTYPSSTDCLVRIFDRGMRYIVGRGTVGADNVLGRAISGAAARRPGLPRNR